MRIGAHLKPIERNLIERMFRAGKHINDVHRATGRSFATLKAIRNEVRAGQGGQCADLKEALGGPHMIAAVEGVMVIEPLRFIPVVRPSARAVDPLKTENI